MNSLLLKRIEDDRWGRKVFKDVNSGRFYKDVDGVLHTTSKDGEPCCPIRKDLKVLFVRSTVGERFSYKGVEYELDGFRGYKIFSPVNVSFRPYAGNHILSVPQSQVNAILKRMIRYRINKFFNGVRK